MQDIHSLKPWHYPVNFVRHYLIFRNWPLPLGTSIRNAWRVTYFRRRGALLRRDDQILESLSGL